MLSPETIAPIEPFRFHRTEYHRLAETGAFEGKHVQLIRGTIIAMSAMGTPHANAIRRLNKLFVSLAPAGLEVSSQLPFAAADDSEPEPDFAFVVEGDWGEDHPSAALLMVEVADSSLKLDLGPKAEIYAECKVPEYWVIDLLSHTTVVHTSLAEGRYTSVHRVAWSQALASTAVPEVTVCLSDLLG